jgi:hypothetical protein
MPKTENLLSPNSPTAPHSMETPSAPLQAICLSSGLKIHCEWLNEPSKSKIKLSIHLIITKIKIYDHTIGIHHW